MYRQELQPDHGCLCRTDVSERFFLRWVKDCQPKSLIRWDTDVVWRLTIITFNKPSSSTLYFIQTVSITDSIWIPSSRSKFKVWPNQGSRYKQALWRQEDTGKCYDEQEFSLPLPKQPQHVYLYTSYCQNLESLGYIFNLKTFPQNLVFFQPCPWLSLGLAVNAKDSLCLG